MKRLTCEMCGSTDLVKQDGVFVCQSCGCKYSVEEAKKMMIEGTVDIKGTVRVDRSSEIDSILKNADTTFSDGNYKEAFGLYSQVLNIEPDNPHAIIYRAVSSAWQSSVKECNIQEINSAAKRAFELKHNQVGDTLEYFNFVTDSVNKVAPCINAIANMYINYYNKAKPTNYTITGAIATSGIAAQVKQTMENGTSNCSVISHNVAVYAMTNVGDYLNSTEGYWTSLVTLIKNAKVYRSNARMGADYDLDRKLDEVADLRAKATDQKNKLQEKRNADYWEEHVQEKLALETEMEGIKEKQKEITDQIRAIDDEARSMPSKDEYDGISSLLRKKEDELNGLGFFKMKEKKTLQTEIDDLKKKKDEAWNIYDKESKAVLEKSIPLYKQKDQLSSRLEEIKKELTKDR